MDLRLATRLAKKANFVKSILDLARIENCLMVGVAAGIGYRSALPAATVKHTLLVAAVPFLVLAFGNTLNDYCDRDLDALAKPQRPLPSGAVSAEVAFASAAISLVAALATQLLMHASLLPFVATMCVLAAAYSTVLKQVPLIGNMIVALQAGCTLLYGGLSAGRVSTELVLGSVVIGWGILVIEVAKAIEDQRSDGQMGIKTVAVLLSVDQQYVLLAGLVLGYGIFGTVVLLDRDVPAPFALVLAPILPLIAALCEVDNRQWIAPVGRALVHSKALWPMAIVGIAFLLN